MFVCVCVASIEIGNIWNALANEFTFTKVMWTLVPCNCKWAMYFNQKSSFECMNAVHWLCSIIIEAAPSKYILEEWTKKREKERKLSKIFPIECLWWVLALTFPAVFWMKVSGVCAHRLRCEYHDNANAQMLIPFRPFGMCDAEVIWQKNNLNNFSKNVVHENALCILVLPSFIPFLCLIFSSAALKFQLLFVCVYCVCVWANMCICVSLERRIAMAVWNLSKLIVSHFSSFVCKQIFNRFFDVLLRFFLQTITFCAWIRNEFCYFCKIIIYFPFLMDSWAEIWLKKLIST